MLIRRLRDDEGLPWDEIGPRVGMRPKAAYAAYLRFVSPPPRRVPEPSRADDERVLDMLARKAAGWTSGEIARDLKVTRSVVCGAIKRVRDECAEMGFDPLEKGETE